MFKYKLVYAFKYRNSTVGMNLNKKRVPLLVPDIGEAEEIELVQWNVKEGDSVKKDQELCELVTTKATFPLESPKDGIIVKILKEKNSKVKIGEELAILEID